MPDGGAVTTLPSSRSRATVNSSTRSPAPLAKSGTRGSGGTTGRRSRTVARMSSRADMVCLLRSWTAGGGTRRPAPSTRPGIPLMKRFLRRLGDVAPAPPGVELAVEGEWRHRLQRERTALGRGAVGPRAAQQLARHSHRGLLHGGELPVVVHQRAPLVDLLVNVYVHGAHVRAAAVDRRRERQLAVTADVRGRHRDDADRAHVGAAVAQPA